MQPWMPDMNIILGILAGGVTIVGGLAGFILFWQRRKALERARQAQAEALERAQKHVM